MAATQLRVVLLTLSVTTLLYLAVKRLCRFGTTERKKIAPHGHPNISG
jgi:uncharacterized damage-inducible protein DinB